MSVLKTGDTFSKIILTRMRLGERLKEVIKYTSRASSIILVLGQKFKMNNKLFKISTSQYTKSTRISFPQ